MSHSVKTPDLPPRPPFDSEFEREQSRVRTRSATKSGTRDAVSTTRRERETELPPPSVNDRDTTMVRESIAERTSRIESKIAMANQLLRTLDPTDRKARLLASGVLRRDEVLLDAVLTGALRDNVVDLPSVRRCDPSE